MRLFFFLELSVLLFVSLNFDTIKLFVRDLIELAYGFLCRSGICHLRKGLQNTAKRGEAAVAFPRNRSESPNFPKYAFEQGLRACNSIE